MSFWDRLLGRPTPVSREKTENRSPASAMDKPVPQPTKPAVRNRDGYPNTFLRQNKQAENARAEVFDPALKHYSHGFRLGDPVFPNHDAYRRWNEARLGVVYHLLRQIENSPLQENLILRGSLTMRAWFGDAARNPGDVDWVFRPLQVTLRDPMADELFTDLTRLATENPQAGEATILTARITQDDIWTYERADGRRIVFPWQVDRLPLGSVQMDVVFGETLRTPVETVVFPTPGGDITVPAASRAESLAWKLLWLTTDTYPQGKDLYDAVLLAESMALPLSLLMTVLEANEEIKGVADLYDWLPQCLADVDWTNFQAEYPYLVGDVEEWTERLRLALAPILPDLRPPKKKAETD